MVLLILLGRTHGATTAGAYCLAVPASFAPPAPSNEGQKTTGAAIRAPGTVPPIVKHQKTGRGGGRASNLIVDKKGCDLAEVEAVIISLAKRAENVSDLVSKMTAAKVTYQS